LSIAFCVSSADALQRLAVGLGDAEHGLGDVAGDGLDAAARAPALDQLVEPAARPLAHEHVDVALALQQALDQMAADEAGPAGDEVAQPVLLLRPDEGRSLRD
jgi:hypothetical protein